MSYASAEDPGALVRFLPLVTVVGLTALAAPAAWAGESAGDDVISWSGYANLDLIGVVSGATPHVAGTLDKEALVATVRWRGFDGVIDIMTSSGAKPNADPSTFQGIDNNEVGSARLRLFEAWARHDLGASTLSLKGGLIDLNGQDEFQVTSASGLLLTPAFQVTPELAASGPKGPSVFPATGLTLQLDARSPGGLYGRIAASNADLGTLGDRGGIDTRFRMGLLWIAEAGYLHDDTMLSVGAWRYSRRQDDLFDLAAGLPVRQVAAGAYVLIQRSLFGGEIGPKAVGFFRAGLSDGDTGPLKASWSAGVSIEDVGGEGRVLSVGIAQAMLGDKLRAAATAGGASLAASELAVEATYSATFANGVTFQPDLQYLARPGGDRSLAHAFVIGLRLTKTFGE